MFSKSSKPRAKGDIACIFVHAGAGFHSKDNEAYHLQACNDACKAAMAVMRAGGSAVDAVEIAIKALEDREITNAGYGSNLCFDGVVECDAIIVDPYGRSGAVGGVSCIKNPISLARILLDHSTQSLSLRRVPPNLLVAQGAVDFAQDHGMVLASHEELVSPFAKGRWQKWRADLAKAERHKYREETKRFGISPMPSEPDLAELPKRSTKHEETRKIHEKQMQESIFNDAQPISPPVSEYMRPDDDSTPDQRSSPMWSRVTDDDTKNTTPNHPDEYADPIGPPGSTLLDMSHHPFANSTQKLAPHSPVTRVSSHGNIDGEEQLIDLSADELDAFQDTDSGLQLPSPVRPHSLDSVSDDTVSATLATTNRHASPPSPSKEHAQPSIDSQRNTPASPVRQDSINVDGTPYHARPDNVTDTVGAIAIDMYGNIACGASSGGISMKHRGRIGPAALVGVGAAVIPVDDEDDDRMTVATVTSGTGEHMSTTFSANVCSERIFHSVRKVGGGGRVEECMEEEAIRGFIQKDFMGHSSVKNSDSNGAIGMLSVKKTKDGAWLYFGHNTDSFALASFHSDETRPICTMSRSNGSGSIAQGGRGIRYRKKR